MSVESGSAPELPYLAWVPYEVTSCVDVRKRGSFWVVGDVKTATFLERLFQRDQPNDWG